MPDDDLFNLVEEEIGDEDAAAGAEEQVASVGQRLREQRRRQGASLYQAAQELRIDPAVLRAIEADDFSLLGAPVYIKGHLRKYAALLGLAPDSVFDDYARTHEISESTPIVNRAVDPGRPYKGGRWLRGAVMLLVIAAIGVATAWWSRRSETAPGDVTAGDGPVAAGALSVYSPPTMAYEDAAVAPTGTVEPDILPEPQAPVATTGAALRIDLAFNGDSWIEMTDADGNQLLFGLMDAGASYSVEGTPPVEVLLGSAEAVGLQVDGEPYVVPPGSVRDGVARFAIERTVTGP
ncbi:MAG: helix-turn-helix domain-containing protein [Gammaproteobacteria bacterium]